MPQSSKSPRITRTLALLAAQCLFLSLFILVTTAHADPFEVSLDGDWDFVYARDLKWNGNDRPAPVLPDKAAYVATMPVPAYWDDHLDRLQATEFWASAAFNPQYRPIEFPMSIAGNVPDAKSLNLYGGGFYRKTFDAPADWSGRGVTLHIGGARINCWAWLNGSFLGYHEMHGVPFEYSLDQYLKPGEKNEIVIAVANNRGYAAGGLWVWGYQGPSAGIYRPVYLRVTGKGRISDLYVYPQNTNTKLVWNVETAGVPAGSDAALDWAIEDPETGAVLGKGATPVTGAAQTWTTETFGMKPWSDHQPNLHRLVLTLKQNGNVLDTVQQSFGLRSLLRDGTGLKLNGRPVMLRGCTESYYFPLTTLTPLEIEPLRGMILKLKQLGFNWMRFHSWVPTEEYMQAADELGMMIQVEGHFFRPEGQWLEIMRTCRKHPSVVLYCTGNEYHFNDERIGWVRDLAGWVHKNVPDALFNPMEYLGGVDSYFSKDPSPLGADVVQKPFPHSASRLKALLEFSDVLAPNTTMGKNCALSYSVAATNWRSLDERLVLYQRPVLYHELGILGNYMDLGLEHRYEGTRIGTDLYAAIRRYLTKNGLIDKAPTYYRNSCRWMQVLRKHCVETARSSKYITGYDMLGAWDFHWHRSGYPCGIMNEFFEMKPGESEADVLKYNGESVILLDCAQKRNLQAGQICSYDIRSSLYGDQPLQKGKLAWYLTDHNGRIYERGEITLKNVQTGCIASLGAIKFAAPKVENPLKLTLYATLSGGEYELTNDWNFWAFPKSAVPSVTAGADGEIISKFGGRYKGLSPARNGDSIRVVSELNADAIKFLDEGGRVILLGSKPFPTRPCSFDPCPTGRAEGNLATVIADHPLTNRFPNEGWCDWQFYSLLSGSSIVVFNDLGLPFDPILDVAGSFKLIRKQSNLFEYAVGRGKLLVCTMSFDLSDPGAAYILDRILSYGAGSEFQPGRTIESAHERCPITAA